MSDHSLPPAALGALDPFYSWTAGDNLGCGAGGVTDEPGRAWARLNEALDALAPGASGFVESVRLDRIARQPSYVHGAVLLRRRRRGDIELAGGE
ncbi:hypothetical protein ACFLIM_09090 [Nonomuraea sp. M3C6]|uniref:Uncharacterized protein n=1 Tax=Nonomuraea marmarensis TaxID=3351344 RepID=A0ABW7A7L2_9ACTN